MEKLGEVIRAERKKTGLTMKELASKIDVSIMTLQRIEVGKVDPSVDLMVKIAHSLKSPLSVFVVDKVPFLHLKKSNQYKKDKTDWNGRAKVLLPPGLMEPGSGISIIDSDGRDGKINSLAEQGKICGFVLEGRLNLDYENKKQAINKGDVFAFDSTKRHDLAFVDPGRVVIWQL